MRRKIGMLVLVFVAMILIAGVVSLLFPATPPKPPKPLPKPNGYDAFVQAGRTISNNIYDFSTASRNQLAAPVDANSNALKLVRIGLQQECRTSLPEGSELSVSNHIASLLGLKHLAYALEAEGRLAEMEGRPADAAKSRLDTIEFGINSYQGGVPINVMVGVAIEAIGTENLRRLTAPLDSESCRDIAARLEKIDAGRQQWKSIVDQDRDWRQHSRLGLKARLLELFHTGSTEKALQSTEQKLNQQAAKTRRLSIEFAARAYELEHQQKPASFADLVPAYLKTIPQDPLTGTNMVFAP